jgi:tetratricopeptide (TPR) repeat protein
MDAQFLPQTLNQLTTAHLVAVDSSDELSFRHSLTRDAVYSSLLMRDRRALHRGVAEALEYLYPDDASAQVTNLAYHYYEAGDWAKALAYSQQAGEKAQSMYAPREAIAHFTRALEAAHQLSPAPPVAHLYRARGKAYDTLGEFERARADHEAALSSARAAGDPHAEWQALLDLGFLWAARDYARTGEYFRHALELARTMNDPAALGHTLNRLGNWHANVEEPREAARLHHEALGIFQRLNDRAGLAETYDLLGLTNLILGDWSGVTSYYEQAITLLREVDDRMGLVSALATYAERCYTYQGNLFLTPNVTIADGLRDGEEALKIAREIGWRSGEAYCLNVLAGILASGGDAGRALELAQASLKLAREIEHRQWISLNQIWLGGIYAELFALDLAQQELEGGLAVAREVGSMNLVGQGTPLLAKVHILRGTRRELARAAATLEATFGEATPIRIAEVLEQGPLTFSQWLWLATWAEFVLARGDVSGALKLVEQLNAAYPTPVGTPIPHLWSLQCQALLELKRFDQAEALLQAARSETVKRGARPVLYSIDINLGKLYRATRRAAEAEEALANARALIEELAATIPDAALRENFKKHALALIPRAVPARIRKTEQRAR